MRQANFVERHRKEWDEMREFLASSKRTADSRPFAGADFPARYRRLCQQLSVAESRGYSRGLQQELHDLVLRAHQQLYAERVAPWRAIARFLLLEYPQLVRSQWRYLAVAFALFMAPILILIATIQYHPDFVHSILDPDEIATMEFMYNPELQDRVGRQREADTDFRMFTFYIRNNTSIGFRTFVGGILFGIGTVFFLLFNGLTIGAIAGHLTHLGYTETFWGFVSGHSAFELTAIMLSGAAGLLLGHALIAPGARSRRLALRESAAVGVKLMYGAAALFLAAAFVEAYWSSLATIPVIVKYGVGGLLWILVGAYFLIPGSRRES